METRTNWEIAGVTIALAMATGTYNIGKSVSDDTVKLLEKSIASYEKLDKLNTEEFIDMAITTTLELKLSVTERTRLRQMEAELEKLKSESDKKTIKLNQLVNDLKNKENIIAGLNKKIAIHESPTQSFNLPIGSGINLKKGGIQVGLTNIEHGNICHVSVNNEKIKMSAGEFSSLENCRVTLTKCDYYSTSKSATFELICKE